VGESLARQVGLGQPLQMLVEVNTASLGVEAMPHLLELSRQHPEKVIAILRQGELTFLPDLHHVNASVVKAEHHVLITCELPTLATIGKIESDRVTVFRQCGSASKIDWDQELLSQVDREVPRQAPFVRIHVPSLRLALSKSKNLKRLRLDALPMLSKELSWEDSPWNPRNQSFEPRGAVNAVLSYRLED
jgi:hypothetical protein